MSSAYSIWISGLTSAQNGPSQTPQNDGVTNLMKFACNLNPLGPDVRTLNAGAGGTAGLPGKSLVAGKLRLEFIRRKASSNPGITYIAEVGSNLAGWSTFGGTPTVTSINATWERVVILDAGDGVMRFGRLKVTHP